MDNLQLRGCFHVTCHSPEGRLLWRERVANAITYGGLDDLLAAGFKGGTQRSNWYLGLLDAVSYTGVSLDDTLSSHSGWTELTSYTSSTRPGWTTLAGQKGFLGNTSPRSFTLNANAAIKGLFLASDSTKGGTSGILWSTGLYAATRSLLSGQILGVTYSVQASGGGG